MATVFIKPLQPASANWPAAAIQLARRAAAWFIIHRLRIWWNWQTRYFEVVVPQGVQVQVLLCAPFFLMKLGIVRKFAQSLHKIMRITRDSPQKPTRKNGSP
jgi:hypothetical protein